MAGDNSILPLNKGKRVMQGAAQGTAHAFSAGAHRLDRLPHLEFMPNWFRKEFVAATAEFVGTFMFLFFGFAGAQVANTAAAASADPSSSTSITQAPNTSTILYIGLSFGFSLVVNAWIFFRISGGLFNPAVTLGLYLIGAITAMRAGTIFIAQLLAGICSAAVVEALLPGPLAVETTLGPGTSIAQGVFLEMFLTAELIFTIFMLAAEKHKATYLAPVGIGLSLFVAHLTGVYFTGSSLNPARSFGPAVVLRSFPGYHWIYWVGPLLGTLVAVGFYKFVKIFEYQTVNPGQDLDDQEAQYFSPPEDAVTADEVARPNVAALKAQEDIERAESRSRSARGRQSAADTLTGS